MVEISEADLVKICNVRLNAADEIERSILQRTKSYLALITNEHWLPGLCKVMVRGGSGEMIRC